MVVIWNDSLSKSYDVEKVSGSAFVSPSEMHELDSHLPFQKPLVEGKRSTEEFHMLGDVGRRKPGRFGPTPGSGASIGHGEVRV